LPPVVPDGADLHHCHVKQQPNVAVHLTDADICPFICAAFCSCLDSLNIGVDSVDCLLLACLFALALFGTGVWTCLVTFLKNKERKKKCEHADNTIKRN